MEFHCLLPWCQEDQLPPDLPPQNHGCRRELVRYRRPCPGLRRVSYTHFNETEFLHGRPFLSRYVVSFACDSKNFLILYCIIFDKLLISIAYVRGMANRCESLGVGKSVAKAIVGPVIPTEGAGTG
jgi:hypothetical protein